mgnify:CR=1 FL=1
MTRPRISTNLAISADGKISSAARLASGWTSRADHARLLELRGAADALLVGRGTLVADQMTLTVPEKVNQPLRCIVSRGGKIPLEHPVFRKPGGEIHWLVTEERDEKFVSSLLGLTIHQQDLASFLEILATKYGVKHLHCEGGGVLIRSLAEMDAIDEFHLTLAGHTLFGGMLSPTATGIPDTFLPKSLDFEISHFSPRDETGECFLSYRRRAQ